MLHSHERDRTKTHNEGLVGDKDVSTVGRLERDAEAGFCHDHVKVASNWTPYLADARVHASFAPKERPQPSPRPHLVEDSCAFDPRRTLVRLVPNPTQGGFLTAAWAK